MGRSYCVIVCVGLPQSPILVSFPFSIQSLIYTLISLIFTRKRFFSLLPYFSPFFPYRARAVHECGGLVGVTWVAQNCLRIFAQNYSGAQFIVRTRVVMLGPSPDTSPAGDCEVELRVSCVNMNSQLIL